MYNPSTCLHNFDKSMKEWIETQLYARAASHGITDANPIILCGPAARRTHTLARNTGVVGRQGANYVEMYRSTYNDICKQLSDEIERDNVRITYEHTSSLETSSRFIDMDMTGNSNGTAGRDFRTMLQRQNAAFPNELKAIIFTFSIRPRGLAYTISDLSSILHRATGGKLAASKQEEVHNPFDRSDHLRYYSWYSLNSYCRQQHLVTNECIKDTLCYYYNTGGGHMLTGIIIYK